MSYNILKILRTVITAKKPKTKSFLFYDREEKVCCFTYWCYRVREKKMKISELVPQYTPSNFNTNFYKRMTEDIKNGGFNYDKGLITIKVGSKNTIGDGHHRYFIMKDLFGPNHEVTTIQAVDKFNPFLHYLFISLIIRPIKLLYKIIILPKILISSLLKNLKRKKR